MEVDELNSAKEKQNGHATYVCEKTDTSEPERQERDVTHSNGAVNNETVEEKLKFFSLPRKSKLTLLVLCLANFCAGCSFSILAPFFPQEAESKGMSKTTIGFVFSSYQLVSFVSTLVYGNYMVQLGPKFLFVSGVLVSGVCSILFGLLDKSPPGVTFALLSFACRWFEAISVTAFVTSIFAIVCREFPQHITTIFGMTEGGMAIGLMAGPAIGGVLNEVGGFGLPFFVIGGVIILVGFLILLLLPTPQDVTFKRTRNIFSLLRSFLVWEANTSVFLSIYGITFLEPVFSSYLEQFHLSPSLIGLMFVIVPGVYGLTTPLWGYLADKKDAQEILIVGGSVVSGLGYLLLGPSSILAFLPVQLWIIIVGLVLFGLGFGSMYIAPVRCYIIGASELGFENNLETFAFISGIFNAAMYLGSFTGPSVSGALVQAVGFPWATSITSCVLFVWALHSFIYFLIRHVRIKRKKAAIREQCEKETELASSAVRSSVGESGAVALHTVSTEKTSEQEETKTEKTQL